MPARSTSQAYLRQEPELEVLEVELEVGSSNGFQLEEETSNYVPTSSNSSEKLPTSFTYNSAATHLTAMGYKTTNHTVKRWIDRLMLAYRDRSYLLVTMNSRNEVTGISHEGMAQLEAICKYKAEGGTLAEYMERLTVQKHEEVAPEVKSSALVVIDDAQVYQGELIEQVESSAIGIRQISDEFEEMMLEIARQDGDELGIKMAAVRLSTAMERYDEQTQKATQHQKKPQKSKGKS